MSSMTLLTTVVDLAARTGWRLFPLHSPTLNNKVFGCSCSKSGCKHIGKHPRIKDFLNQATNNPAQLTAWWNEFPNANVGVVTGEKSGIFALDADGDIGAASLKVLEENNSPLPETLTTTTGRGFHYYFQHPGGSIRIKTNNGKLGVGLEVKGDNGSCIVPPSNHYSGHPYKFVNADTPIAAAPLWLLDALTAEDVPTPTSDDDIPQGQRNPRMYAEICSLFKTGASKESVLQSALETNRSRCRPPLPEKEIHGLVGSVASTHKPNNASAKPMSSTNPLWWRKEDVRDHLQGQIVISDYQEGWRTRLTAHAWYKRGWLVNDLNALFVLARAGNKAKFKKEFRKALYDFEVFEEDGKSYLVNWPMVTIIGRMVAAWQKRVDAVGKGRDKAKTMPTEKREAIPNETKGVPA
jgi:hypothetical protein